MIVDVFNLQSDEPEFSAKSFLDQIDARVPMPEPIPKESQRSNGNDGVFVCVLDHTKLEDLLTILAQSTTVRLDSSWYSYEIEEAVYRSDYYVHWRSGTELVINEIPN